MKKVKWDNETTQNAGYDSASQNFKRFSILWCKGIGEKIPKGDAVNCE